MTSYEHDAAYRLQVEISQLEQQLQDAKARLYAEQAVDSAPTVPVAAPLQYVPLTTGASHHLHSVLLLSDSALPLGSFAFSSGLESFLAHRPKHAHTPASFTRFLNLSLASLASATLPYVVAGHEEPERLEELDNDLDASITCTVARRASVKQGRAMVAVWERSFRSHFKLGSSVPPSLADDARAALEDFRLLLKAPSPLANPAKQFTAYEPNGHLPPLFGALCAALSIPIPHALYLYLLNHAKTLVSAGIRSSVLGPYQAQAVLASEALRERIWKLVEQEVTPHDQGVAIEGAVHGKRRRTEEAGQSVPVLDLWGGRHEIIYSRIFNS